MLADGFRLAQEACQASMQILELAWSPKLLAREGGEALLDACRQQEPLEHECSDKLMARVSNLRDHQGICLLLRRPQHAPADLLGNGSQAALLVVAAGIQDPGNLGAMMRTAEAAGATGFIALAGQAHPFRDKALRGSAGSAFRLPCWVEAQPAAVLDFLKQQSLQLVVADSSGGQDCWSVDLQKPTAWIMGGEGAGVPAEFSQAADQHVCIPLQDTVESLNVAVATGILLFESKRQRS